METKIVGEVRFQDRILLETKKPNSYYSICDRCGKYSPEGKTRDEAEEKRIHAGWIRRNIEGHWEDICPECHLYKVNSEKLERIGKARSPSAFDRQIKL